MRSVLFAGAVRAAVWAALLRFVVWDGGALRKGEDFPCLACRGGGRVVRPQEKPGFLFRALRPDASAEDEAAYDAADEHGRRSCHGCGGSGRRRPIYGASNDFCRAPGLENWLRRARLDAGDTRPVLLGSRGLARPRRHDVECVIRWCEEIMRLIRGGDRRLRWQANDGQIVEPAEDRWAPYPVGPVDDAGGAVLRCRVCNTRRTPPEPLTCPCIPAAPGDLP